MDFEITENKNLDMRLKIVSKEIIKKYPNIGSESALKIASFCSCVPKKVDADVFFIRYYYILRIIGKMHILYRKVFNDMVRCCDGKLEEKINQCVYDDILKYNNDELLFFPVIGDYYV